VASRGKPPSTFNPAFPSFYLASLLYPPLFSSTTPKVSPALRRSHSIQPGPMLPFLRPRIQSLLHQLPKHAQTANSATYQLQAPNSYASNSSIHFP
jgi:hypothetical protein